MWRTAPPRDSKTTKSQNDKKKGRSSSSSKKQSARPTQSASSLSVLVDEGHAVFSTASTGLVSGQHRVPAAWVRSYVQHWDPGHLVVFHDPNQHAGPDPFYPFSLKPFPHRLSQVLVSCWRGTFTVRVCVCLCEPVYIVCI